MKMAFTLSNASRSCGIRPSTTASKSPGSRHCRTRIRSRWWLLSDRSGCSQLGESSCSSAGFRWSSALHSSRRPDLFGCPSTGESPCCRSWLSSWQLWCCCCCCLLLSLFSVLFSAPFRTELSVARSGNGIPRAPTVEVAAPAGSLTAANGVAGLAEVAGTALSVPTVAISSSRSAQILPSVSMMRTVYPY